MIGGPQPRRRLVGGFVADNFDARHAEVAAKQHEVDLTATIGYDAMIGGTLNAFGIEPTPGEPLLPL